MSDTNEPDAYGLLDQGEVHYATPFRDEAERVLRFTEDKDSVIVPLYRQPTLTDAEREALNKMRVHLYEISRDNAFIDEVCDDAKAACAAVMAFLERHK